MKRLRKILASPTLFIVLVQTYLIERRVRKEVAEQKKRDERWDNLFKAMTGVDDFVQTQNRKAIVERYRLHE